MARIKIQFPDDQICYTTDLTVRITDINGANHLGNDSMISMISEARARFLFDFGIEETADDKIIVTDLATTYLAEAYTRDELRFEIGVMDFNKYGGDIVFRVTRPRDATLIAMAKSGFRLLRLQCEESGDHAGILRRQVSRGESGIRLPAGSASHCVARCRYGPIIAGENMDQQTLEHLRTWVGRSESLDDVVAASKVAALAATLDRDDAWPVVGDPLPPLWHWTLCVPAARQSALGADGHPARGGFLPPVPLPRRMWAGGRLTFPQPLRVGEAVQRRSQVVSVERKSGRSGEMVFVVVRHEYHGPRGSGDHRGARHRLSRPDGHRRSRRSASAVRKGYRPWLRQRHNL